LYISVTFEIVLSKVIWVLNVPCISIPRKQAVFVAVLLNIASRNKAIFVEKRGNAAKEAF